MILDHQVIPEAEDVIEIIQSKQKKILTSYKKGLITESEALSSIDAIEFEIHDQYDLQKWISKPWTLKKWERMQDDYYLWKNNRPCKSYMDEEWLLANIITKKEKSLPDSDEDLTSVYNSFDKIRKEISKKYRIYQDLGMPFRRTEGDETTLISYPKATPVNPIMKNTFFSIMDLLMIPLPDFCFDNKQIEVPAVYSFSSLNEIFFDCVDDDGLFSEMEPSGKRYHIKGEKGIDLLVTIRDVCEGSFIPFLTYHGFGFVKEYMEERDRPLTITYINKDASSFRVAPHFLDEENRNAYQEYPRWKPFFSDMKEKKEKRDKERKELFLSLLENLK